MMLVDRTHRTAASFKPPSRCSHTSRSSRRRAPVTRLGRMASGGMWCNVVVTLHIVHASSPIMACICSIALSRCSLVRAPASSIRSSTSPCTPLGGGMAGMV